MNKEVIDLINSMDSPYSSERVQLAIVTLLYNLTNKTSALSNTPQVLPVSLSIEEAPTEIKKATRKKKVKKDEGDK